MVCVKRTPGMALPKRGGRPGEKHAYTHDWQYRWAPGGKAEYSEWYGDLFKQRNKQDFVVARECIHKVSNASWWTWDLGSALLFWRWEEGRWRRWARDGQPHFLVGDLPAYTRRQPPFASTEERQLVASKVNKVRERRYIEPGRVVSLTPMFHVPKPPKDVRMVYDGTKSRLNDAVWAPHFGLATMRCTLRSLLPGYYQCDMDSGEMFLNFWLHSFLREYAGVDVSQVRTKEGPLPEWEAHRTRDWERWSRNFMGLRDSPYRSIQMFTKMKYVAYGRRTDSSNPFGWKEVRLNLPGSDSYDPSWPWVAKVREDGRIACDMYLYVDDGRVTGPTKLLTWRATRRLCSVITHHGSQDAARKRNEPHTEPGPWAGTVTSTANQRVTAKVSQEKWDKSKALVQELGQLLKEGPLPLKRLEQICGFLIYVARTYS